MPDSGDVDLRVVITALLNSKGFEDAQAKLKGLKPALDDAGGGFANLAAKQNVSTREIKILTAELLRSVGISEGAGAAGRVAAEGFLAMSDAANIANLTLSGFGLAAVLVIPQIIEWIRHTKDTTAEQKALKEALDREMPLLEDYLDKLKKINPELAAIATRIHSDALGKEAEQLKTTRDRTDELNREIGVLLKNQTLAGIQTARDAQINAASAQQTEEVTAALATKRKELIDNMTQERLLREAQDAGLTVTEYLSKAHERDTHTLHDRTEALAEDNRELMRQVEIEAKVSQANIDDAEFLYNLAHADEERGKAAVKAGETIIAEDVKRDRKNADQALRDTRETVAFTKQQKEKTNAVRQFHEDSIAAGVQAAAVFLGLFTKNKAINVAAALTDTFAAADKALNNPPGPPWTIPFAALAVATGLANVKRIESTNVGFDNPFADQVAATMGRRSAEDFAKHFGGMFSAALPGAMAQQITQHHYHTNNDYSVHRHIGTVNGVLGSRTEFRKWFEREDIRALRVRNRTSI